MDQSTINETALKFLQERLLNWYIKNGRDFIWRKRSITKYELIIAEIFLQRTRAETVARYLPTFYKRYPNWTSLGNSSLTEIQDSIKELGLYQQRGTRLYLLAQEILKRNGRFPKSRDKIEALPMMGQYMTNAYELYFKSKRVPLLDVNMARILERYFSKRKLTDIRFDPYLQEVAYRVVDVGNSKELNWAILDLGSLICKAKNPDCNNCPVSTRCNYFISLK